MSKVQLTEQSLEDIADAIREKNGEQTQYKPSEMAPAIRAIETGGGGNLPEVTAADNEKLLKVVSGEWDKATPASVVEEFVSSDVADGSASAWTSVTTLATGEQHSSIFAKVSQMFKNIRYLYKMLGTTDISTLGGGTVTGALSHLDSRYISATSVDDLSTQVLALGTNKTYTAHFGSSIVSAIIGSTTSTSGKGLIWKYSATVADIFVIMGSSDGVYYVRFNPTAKTFGTATKQPTREEVDALKGIIPIDLTSNDSLLTVALDTTICPADSVRYFNLRNANASDLPAANCIYGMASVIRRTASTAFVMIYPESRIIYYNVYANSQWYGWYTLNVGTTTISAIGDGSLTGAISAVNTALSNVTASETSTALTSLDDIPFRNLGRYKLAATISPTGAEAYFNILSSGSSNNYKTIIATSTTATDKNIYKISKRGANTWDSWEKLPSREELGTTDISAIGNGSITGAISDISERLGNLNASNKTISKSATQNFTITSGKGYLFILTGAASGHRGMYIVYANSNGGVSVTEVLAASLVTITTSTNTMTVENTNASYGVVTTLIQLT